MKYPNFTKIKTILYFICNNKYTFTQMNYKLLTDVIGLLQEFEATQQKASAFSDDIDGFKNWIISQAKRHNVNLEPDWEGKQKGRSAESVINTLIVHMGRYAKSYSRSAILGSSFSSQDDFIYLITLQAFGAMSKMELIKKNVQDKPAGMQIINRLIKQGWVQQTPSKTDRREKLLEITAEGIRDLNQHMSKIRQASHIVTANLDQAEKMELIRLLTKLDAFHLDLYQQNIASDKLLETGYNALESDEE